MARMRRRVRSSGRRSGICFDKMSTHITDDRDISVADVQALATRDGVATFFAALGYRTDSRQPQSVSAMGITTGALARQINHIERIAVHDDGAEALDSYLIELTSVTIAATRGLARALRNRAGNYLLVLTDDYERLDFVLLQRSLPGMPTSSLVARQVSVRPRILTVNRRNPSLVQLRVLRRFTYTEPDADAQYEKLLSAYAVAEWSEPLFNNRALFSDYYLNDRLPELADWKERPEYAYHRLRELIPRLRDQSSAAADDSTVQPPIETALEILGFQSAKAAGGDEPDYRLYAPGNPEKPVAVCLAYSWNRYLDGKDEARDAHSPDENPGARVVAILESGEAAWAIVTNGKLWRIYSARTHSRSTNYYEIDLDETLGMADPNESFRYFWLFFRHKAFVMKEIQLDGRAKELSFLDRLLEESEIYAKGLGERLKDRVFEQVFPYFAAGFIKHSNEQVGLAGTLQTSLLPIAEQLPLKREPDEVFCRQVFNGTLTLLYRLLFLMYAESRDLLPVKEVRGYWERSLTKLKADIAVKAGPIGDAVPNQLRKAYRDSADATDLYDRLLDLFSVIDLGSHELNVPIYNGGLFITKPDQADRTQEAETARFLASHKIPDRYLALGLDLLARDLDDKRQDLVFIDYKSLGVRQLGSIYEGLLEFTIRIAQEEMAVVKGKKTEEVVPYQEAIKSKRKVLTLGRGLNTEERVYQPGDVYLENDRRERKATGSYYTPDHIVKYIVDNTVGPVLAEKFDRLRSEFRDAQKDYRKAQIRAKAFRRQGMKPDDPAKVANAYAGLVDDLFDLKVLDPAMGSGHFLVEAVDFICDRILGERAGFLRAFPWNPVTKFLQDTRDVIVTEMERQGVAVDTGRLTDINLLKRHVLKRCAYGVDLNPMAVELAKVSLWLDCFTIGAPLSFLDHHLKCGNSLIGTTVQEIENELAKETKGHAGTLFGGPFQGLLSATASIEELRRIPDATAEEAERSHSLYTDFERAQAPYRAALDIWVSQHFGNTKAREYLTLAGPDLVEQIRSGGTGLSSGYRKAIAEGRKTGTGERFFHWDLEFPEAFVDLGRSTWKHEDDQGFDVVVGNPPYHRIQGIPRTIKDYLKKSYECAMGKFDLSVVFVERGLQCTKAKGLMGFIIPNKPLTADYGKGLRGLVSHSKNLVQIVDFQDAQVFPEASIYACLLLLSGSARETTSVGIAPTGKLDNVNSHEVPVSNFTGQPWSLSQTKPTISSALYHTLGQACEAIFQGLISGADAILIGRPRNGESFREGDGFPSENEVVKPLLRGKNIRRFAIQDSGEYVIYPYQQQDSRTRLIPEDELADRFPETYSYLLEHRPALSSRGSANMYPTWYALWNPRQIDRFQKPKLLTQVLAGRATFAIDLTGAYWFVGGGNAGVYGVIPRGDLDVDIWYLLAYLNSTFFDQEVKSVSSRFRGGFHSYAKRFIQNVPARVTGFSAMEQNAATHISNLVRSCYTQKSFNESVWPEIDKEISELHKS